MRKTNQNMGKLVTASALAIGLAAVAQSASAGISTTRHNMGSPSATFNRTGGTNEICVFCHTPHGSNTSVSAPLWNKYTTKTASNYTSYTTANSATFDAQGSQTGPGSVSMACLTCHDGSQAMDNMMNAPGAGGITTDGGGISGLQTGYTWTAGGNSTGVTTADGLMLGGAGTRNALLGTDLSNDHPVGMNYCANPLGNNTITTINTTNCGDTDFAVGTTVSGRSWIDTGTAGSFQKTDFPLYSAGTSTVKVECATCHDPHDASNGTFLRKSNAGSGVCLTCHVK